MTILILKVEQNCTGLNEVKIGLANSKGQLKTMIELVRVIFYQKVVKKVYLFHHFFEKK